MSIYMKCIWKSDSSLGVPFFFRGVVIFDAFLSEMFVFVRRRRKFSYLFGGVRNKLQNGEWFEPRGISYLFGVIVRVKVVFRKTVVGDWRFDYLSGSHLQSQMKSRRQMMVFMPLVLVLIGQFYRDVIGRQNVKVVVISRLFCCYFLFIFCLCFGSDKQTIDASEITN